MQVFSSGSESSMGRSMAASKASSQARGKRQHATIQWRKEQHGNGWQHMTDLVVFVEEGANVHEALLDHTRELGCPDHVSVGTFHRHVIAEIPGSRPSQIHMQEVRKAENTCGVKSSKHMNVAAASTDDRERKGV